MKINIFDFSWANLNNREMIWISLINKLSIFNNYKLYYKFKVSFYFMRKEC